MSAAPSAFYRPPAPLRARRRGPLGTLARGLALAFAALSAVGAVGLLLKHHSRFAIKRIVLDGVPESRRAEAEAITDHLLGQPLLFADLDTAVLDLAAKPWAARVAARRVVPDTLSVTVVARPPFALARRGDALWTVDRTGTFLGPYEGRSLSGKERFVVIDVIDEGEGLEPGSAAEQEAVARGTELLSRLTADDPALAARLSEIEVAGSVLSAVDGSARCLLLFGDDALQPGAAATRWRAYLALVPELERNGLPTELADLRFRDRIVLKAPPKDAASHGKT